MDDIELVRERLNNIRGVEPIISSLRTIAAGSWRLALRRRRAADQYTRHLSTVLRALMAHSALLEERRRPWSQLRPFVAPEDSPPQQPLMLVIASERGLCGAFNDVVLNGADRLIVRQQRLSARVQVATLGRRADQYFRTQGMTPVLSRSLPLTQVASMDTAQSLTDELLNLLRKGETDAIYVIYSPYQASGVAEPVAARWLPFLLSGSTLFPPQSMAAATPAAVIPDPGHDPERTNAAPPADGLWPLPIIESHLQSLWQAALHQWALGTMFKWTADSAASEHAARYRAMEAASSNLSNLIEELTLRYHSARQHAITMEMLDLVGGSGLLRRRDSSRPATRR